MNCRGLSADLNLLGGFHQAVQASVGEFDAVGLQELHSSKKEKAGGDMIWEEKIDKRKWRGARQAWHMNKVEAGGHVLYRSKKPDDCWSMGILA